jgi:hypothetical protein
MVQAQANGPAQFSLGNGALVSMWGQGSGVFSACV